MNIKIHRNIMLDLLVIIVDALAVFGASWVTFWFVSMFVEAPFHPVSVGIEMACIFFMFYIYDFYTKMIRGRYEILLSVAISVMVATLARLAFELLIMDYDPWISVVSALTSLGVMFLLLGACKLITLSINKRIEGVAKLLVIESKGVENSLARKVKYSYMSLYEAWYVQIDVDDQAEIERLVKETLPEYASVFLSPSINDELKNYLIGQVVAQRKELYILPDLYNINVMKCETVQFEDTPALRVRPLGLTKNQRLFKRLLDIVISLTAVIVTSPIMLAIALLIKLDSPGSVLYKQERLTLHEHPFHVLKFRTMRQDAEKLTGAVMALDDDPRITRVGKVLRALRLDELPQFFNILGGSMSFVGPRPERRFFVDQFKQEVENYDKRFFAKAGLTGSAQVYARYDTTAKDKLLYDLLYIRDYSFFLDIKLILLTIKTVLTKESAQGYGSRVDYTQLDRHEDGGVAQ